MSNEKKPGCLVYIGDEILPSSIEIVISHCKKTRIQWKGKAVFFFVAHVNSPFSFSVCARFVHGGQ